MKRNPQDWRKLLPGVIVSLIALAVIFYLVDFHALLKALQQADYRFIALLLLATISWLLVRGLVWRTLLREKATFTQTFLTLNEGYLLNNVLPFRLGEVGRAFLLSRKANLGFMTVLSSIVIERILDVGLAAGLLLASLPFVIGGDFTRSAAFGAAGLVALGILVLYLIARNQAWTERQFERLAARLPVLQRAGGKQLNALLTGLSVLTDGRRFFKTVLLIVLNWVIAVLQFYLLLRAFFPQAQLLWATFTLGVMALGVALPSSPGSIAVMEASIMGALAAFVNDPSTALAAAIIAHLNNYLSTGLIGVYALARDGQSLSSLYRDVRQIPPSDPIQAA